MAHYKAVLFDADGTLWYSQTSPKGVWREILENLGFDMRTEQVEVAWEREWKLLEPQYLAFESTGHPNEPSAIESMWAASEERVVDGLGLTVDLKRLRRVADERFTVNVDLCPETVEVLAKLRTMGMQMAIVSNGVNQERAAGRLGIDGCFDRIVGSVHVGFAKPSPEIFHIALRALEVSPEEAIMFGDTWDDDVEGAKNAGIRGVHLNRSAGPSPGAESIKDLRGVLRLLAQT
ncbi:MAG: HAD family hydrolase [Chloroflexi bacterium]|nr:HAD family hydrolase [Chloroflexota bacterium]